MKIKCLFEKIFGKIKTIKIGWQTKLAIVLASLSTSLLLLSVAHTSFAQDQGPANPAEIKTVEDMKNYICSVREKGVAPTVLISGAAMVGPVISNSECSGLGDFMYAAPEMEKILPPETSGMINPSSYVHGGLTGQIVYYGSLLYENPPASTPQYTRYLAEKIGIAQPAYAQMTFSKAFSPLITLWQRVRDITLVIMTVIMLAIGLMIMIRARMGGGGRESIDIMSSFVSFGVALVLITFSYPIACFVIDLGTNVANAFVASLFAEYINSREILTALYTPGSGWNIISLTAELQNFGVGTSLSTLLADSLQGLGVPVGHIKEVFGNMQGAGWSLLGLIGQAFSWLMLDQILMGILWSLTNGTGGMALATAILSFVLFITSLRIVFALLSAYFSMVMKVAFSPLAFLGVAFPGGYAGIWSFIKALLSDALVFPTTFAILLFAAVLFNLRRDVDEDFIKTCMEARAPVLNSRVYLFDTAPYTTGKNQGDNCYPLLLPPKFNYWPAPFGYIYGVEPDSLVRLVLGFGVFLLAPTGSGMWREILNVKEYRFLRAIGGGFSAGFGAFAGIIERVPSLGIGRGIAGVVRQMGGSLVQ